MFIELRARTNLSFLTGASDTREYIRQAKAIGMPAIGITDLNGVYGLPRALEAIKDDCPDMRLICGADLRIKDHPRVSLIARTRTGWGLLCRIITALHHGKEKGEGSLTIQELTEIVKKYPGADGLFCIVDVTEATAFTALKDIFAGQLYLALCRYIDGLDKDRTKMVLQAAKRHDLPIVATNDVHYHVPDRRPIQDCFTAIRLGKPLDDVGFDRFDNSERYLKCDLQMRALFSDVPEAITNTKKIADACEFQISDLTYSYPTKFVPAGETPRSYLERLVFEGAMKRYGTVISDKVAKQIKAEIELICRKNDAPFFLSFYDICSYAREVNIYYNARGSAVNSLVCFCLYISSIDPIRSELNFSRFLNIARNEPPDIDVDFEHDRREEIIQWIYTRYGRDHAAMVAAIQTYKPDGATLDFSKALGAEIGTISAGAVRERIEKLYGAKAYRIPMLSALMTNALDSPRNISTHSGGFFISDEELPTLTPVEPARMQNRTILQWDKNDLETLGWMKEDILSIGFLTVIHKACEPLGIVPDDIPWDCPKTFAMIGRGETHGCFQIESRAQINTNQQTRPQKQYDLVIGVSIVRPLASEGGMVKSYLRGLRNKLRGIAFQCGNPVIERILRRTNGIPLFPEQMMQIAKEVGGFDDFEAEHLRKSLGKSRSAKSVGEIAEKLYATLITSGVSKEFADTFFSYVQGYSSYGFPESHAASYAVLAYRSAWLKFHHPTELLLGLLNSQPMGFYTIDTLIYEAQRNSGVRIMPVHPNLSDWDAKLESPGTIRMGFRNIRGIREEPVGEMIKARESKSFTSVEDFIARTNFNADVLENMALANIFECWRLDRRHTFWQTLEFHRLTKRDIDSSIQLSLLDERSANTPVKNLFSQMRLVSEQFLDYMVLGYSPKGNPMLGLRTELPNLPSLTSEEFKLLPHKKMVSYAGIVTVLQRPPPAKGTAFMTLEDEYGAVDAIIRKEVYEKYRSVIASSRFLIITGRVQLRKIISPTGIFEMRTLIVERCEAFGQMAESKPIRPQEHPRSLGKMIGEHAFSG